MRMRGECVRHAYVANGRERVGIGLRESFDKDGME